MTEKKNVSLPCAVGSTSYIDTVKNDKRKKISLLSMDRKRQAVFADCKRKRSWAFKSSNRREKIFAGKIKGDEEF